MILFAICESQKGCYAAGQWKDIESIKIVLGEVGIKYEIVYFDYNNYEHLLVKCTDKIHDIIIYYSFWPDLLLKISIIAPWISLHVRTVNAEALQHWQRVMCSPMPTYDNARVVYGFARLLWLDLLCRYRANTLLGISNWDNKHYWKYFPGRAKIYDVPYYSPWPCLRPQVQPLPYEKRTPAIVCMAGGRDPIGRKMVLGFFHVAKQLSECDGLDEWKFLLSPGISSGQLGVPISPAVTLLETLDEPWDLLCSVRAVAVLTPLGYGAKTTVIDGIAAGCHVVVHPIIARRLPEEIKKLCIQCDVENRDEVEDLRGLIKKPPLANNANEFLHALALDNLKKSLTLEY